MKKRYFKNIAFVLAMILATTTAAFAAAPSDVIGKPYEKAVIELMEKGIITGDADGMFHSDNNLKRSEACVIVVKAMEPASAEVVGTPTQKVAKSGFADMNGYGWADGYVGYAVKQGITKGIGENKFAPSAKVTTQELVTMLLRAAGYTDSQLQGTWPENYMKKAEELGIFEGLGEVSKLPNPATKAVAAQLTYNGVDEIKAAKVVTVPAKSTEAGFTIGITKMTYGTGSFNENMTAYAGKAISSDVLIYTYGKQTEYKADMVLSKTKGDYVESTIYKYKNAKTPCFYNMVGSKITEMIIPMDAGFSGTAYGVVNDISTQINGSKEKVKALETLIAGKEIVWLERSSNAIGLPSSSGEYLNGEIYEMNTYNGQLEEIHKASDTGHNADFVELTHSNFTDTVENFSSNVVTTQAANDNMFGVKENASVYVLSDNGNEYTVGTLRDIKKGVKIRAYDISKNETVASIIVVKK